MQELKLNDYPSRVCLLAKNLAFLAGFEKPLPKREVDNARKEIVASAKKLEESGEVNLADILGGGEMVE